MPHGPSQCAWTVSAGTSPAVQSGTSVSSRMGRQARQGTSRQLRLGSAVASVGVAGPACQCDRRHAGRRAGRSLASRRSRRPARVGAARPTAIAFMQPPTVNTRRRHALFSLTPEIGPMVRLVGSPCTQRGSIRGASRTPAIEPARPGPRQLDERHLHHSPHRTAGGAGPQARRVPLPRVCPSQPTTSTSSLGGKRPVDPGHVDPARRTEPAALSRASSPPSAR